MKPFAYAVVREGSPAVFFEGERAYEDATRAALNWSRFWKQYRVVPLYAAEGDAVRQAGEAYRNALNELADGLDLAPGEGGGTTKE